MTLRIAATGHRPSKLGGHWNPTAYLPVIERLARHFILKAQAEQLEIISGMALGWDMIVAAAAIIAKDQGATLTLTCALPFEGQHKRWTDQTSLAWYWRLRARADSVVVVSEGGYDRHKMLKRTSTWWRTPTCCWPVGMAARAAPATVSGTRSSMASAPSTCMTRTSPRPGGGRPGGTSGGRMEQKPRAPPPNVGGSPLKQGSACPTGASMSNSQAPPKHPRVTPHATKGAAMTMVFYTEHDFKGEVLCARCLAKLGFVPHFVLAADPCARCKKCRRSDTPGPRRPDCDPLTFETALHLIIQLSREHAAHAYHVITRWSMENPAHHYHAKPVIEDALTDHTAGFNMFELVDLQALLTPSSPKVLRKSKGQRSTIKPKGKRS